MPIAHADFKNLHVFEHPLVQDKIARARDVETPHSQFRRLLNEIAGLMTYEVCRELKTRDTDVRTPIGVTNGRYLDEPLTLVPILRAGIGMTDGILGLLPEARVGHVGLYRDEKTLEPVECYGRKRFRGSGSFEKERVRENTFHLPGRCTRRCSQA
jgi:uracil phosphoribosyltransferase